MKTLDTRVGADVLVTPPFQYNFHNIRHWTNPLFNSTGGIGYGRVVRTTDYGWSVLHDTNTGAAVRLRCVTTHLQTMYRQEEEMERGLASVATTGGGGDSRYRASRRLPSY